MYVSKIKTIGLEALRATFDAQYPVAEFRGLRFSLEYPIQKTAVPQVWLRYTDTGPLKRYGVAHIETEDPATEAAVEPFTRFRFDGSWELVVVALSSLERDRIFDELVSVVAASGFDSPKGRFRRYLETNDLIDVTLNSDQIESTGESAEPGTPWGTDEVVYERTLNIDMTGDFVSDVRTGVIVPLSRIAVKGEADPELDAEARGEGFGGWH